MRSLHDGPAKKKDKVLCATTISRDREISAALTVASEFEYLFGTSGVRALPPTSSVSVRSEEPRLDDNISQ